MKPAQQIIKYLAIAFAMFLIVNIFSAILYGIHIFANVLGLDSKENSYSDTEKNVTDFKSTNIATLNIKVEYSNLTIKTGDVLKAESSSNTISCKQNGNQILVEEQKQNLFSKDTKNEVIIYIPSTVSFDAIYIETGARKCRNRKSYFKKFISKTWCWKSYYEKCNYIRKS